MKLKIALVLTLIVFGVANTSASNHPEITDYSVNPSAPEADEDFTITVRADDTEQGNAEYPGVMWIRVTIDGETKTENCGGEQEISCEREFDFDSLSEDNYDVTIEAKDTDFLTTEDTRDLDIEETNLEPSFTFAPDNPEVEETIEFDASESEPEGDIDSYEWDFDDGNEAEGEEVEHAFDSRGDYDVTLTIEVDGEEESTEREVTVEPQEKDPETELEASFNASKRTAVTGEDITFDASDSEPEGEIDSYEWSFGNGNTAEGETVAHNYSDTGDYRVQLEVEKDDNTDTTSETVSVEREPTKCDIHLSLNVDGLESGRYLDREDVATARATVTNDGGAQDFTVKILVGGEEIRSFSENNFAGQATYSASISPERDSSVRAVLEKGNGPCRHQSDEKTESKDIVVLQNGDPTPDPDDKGVLEVEVEGEDGEELEDVRIEAENGERHVRYTDSDGETSMSLEPGDYEVEASKFGYLTEEQDVEIEEGETERIEYVLEESEEVTGRFTALVEDMDGDRLEDARVEVENGDSEIEYTDEDGRADFDLESGDYDVEVSKTGYNTRTEEIEIDEEEETVETIHLSEEGEAEGLQITDVDHDDSICKGGTFRPEITIDNTGGFHELVTISARGFGTLYSSNSFAVDEGETVNRKLTLANVQGSDTEEFEITVTNHNSDSVTRTVEVEDCLVSPPRDGAASQPTGITMDVSPQQTVIGNSFMVKGYVDGIRGRTNVEVEVGGETKARVSTERDGYYQTYVKPESIGKQMIRVSTDGQSSSREINVLPTASVGAVSAPQKIFEGEDFEVCANVRSQVDPEVFLVKDGRIIASIQDSGEVCFERTASDTGTHKYEIRALTYSQTSSSFTTVETLEAGNEVESFPDQVATVESEEGLVKVDLYNNNEELRRYDVSLIGLPSTWTAQTEKEVALAKGERKTVYFYLTPRSEGTYIPEVQIDSEGSTIFRQDVTLEVGGTKNSENSNSKSLMKRINQFFNF